jgi:hypothetical protein
MRLWHVQLKHMKPKQLRALALRDPAAFKKLIRGARARELTARHLLLHPNQVASASAEDLAALRDYVVEEGWRSLYGHDRRMYKLLKAGAQKLLLQSSRHIPVSKRLGRLCQA